MNQAKRVVVLGAKGMLGHVLVDKLQKDGWEVHPFDLPELDITNRDKTAKTLVPLHPKVIVNCAAFTNVDACETQQELAFAVNSMGAGNAAKAAADAGALLVHISTDYVFDGTKTGPYLPDDTPNPINVYGKSKLEGEINVRREVPDHLILRTAWLFGPSGKNFVTTILEHAKKQHVLNVVNDQRGSPTYTIHLAEGIMQLLNTRLRGTHHLTNSGVCTWYEFAQEIISRAGLPAEIRPVTTVEFPRPAKRPLNSVLEDGMAKEVLRGPLKSWNFALAQFLEKLEQTPDLGKVSNCHLPKP